MSKEKIESAKVYVFDFHFSAENKMDIANKKTELNIYFDFLRKELEESHHNGLVKCEVFLRKH